MEEFKWSDISTYRGELFGLSIISVIILHYLGSFTSNAPNRVIQIIAKAYSGAIGSVGVDIFSFLSGYGIYYSLKKKKDLKAFYQKRFQRVLFPYLVLGVVFWTIKDFIFLKEKPGQFLFDLSLLSFWVRGTQTFWYVAYICLMYAFSPILIHLTKSKGRIIFGVAAMCVLDIACWVLFPEYFNRIEIALQRIPSFLMGLYCGRLSKSEDRREKNGISRWLLIVLLLSIPVKVLSGIMNHPLSRLINGFFAMFLVVFYVLLRKRYSHWQSRFFVWMSSVGVYSLEIYLLHVSVRNLMGTLQFNMQNPLIYLVHLLVIIPLTLCFASLQKVKLFELIKKRGCLGSNE